MIFTEIRFLVFFAIAFGVHWALLGLRARKLWLLACSYFFYACWDWRFLSLILFSTLVDYFAGLGIERSGSNRPRARRAWLALSLIANIGLLATFKYLGFLVDSGVEFLAWLGLETSRPTLAILLPVGISFYTFQTLSYTLDIWFGRLRATKSLLDVATFVAFFPQLVAGPIVRAVDFLPQLRAERRFDRVHVRACLALFFVGYFKKAVVSDNVAPIVDAFFDVPMTYDTFGAWGALLMFSVQLYCDFSGYSDMAIGAAGLLGYELSLNFAYPFLAPNLRHFWRRWHISLSSWFNDYVYLPLGGSRGSKLFGYRNTLLSMTLAGLWHGAAWNFVLWGLYHGIALILYQEWSRRRSASSGTPDAPPGLLRTFVSTAFTFWIVACSMIFFRARDMENFRTACEVLFLGAGEAIRDQGMRPHLAFVVLALLHWASSRRLFVPLWRDSPEWLLAAGWGATAALLLALMNSAIQPFIYFQF